jgi:hypothetical protein
MQVNFITTVILVVVTSALFPLVGYWLDHRARKRHYNVSNNPPKEKP